MGKSAIIADLPNCSATAMKYRTSFSVGWGISTWSLFLVITNLPGTSLLFIFHIDTPDTSMMPGLREAVRDAQVARCPNALLDEDVVLAKHESPVLSFPVGGEHLEAQP